MARTGSIVRTVGRRCLCWVIRPRGLGTTIRRRRRREDRDSPKGSCRRAVRHLGMPLPAILLADLVDPQRVKPRAVIHSRARAGCRRPMVGRFEIDRPEWPGAALQRTALIYPANGFRTTAYEEHAIAVWPLGQTEAKSDSADILGRYSSIRTPQSLGYLLLFFGRNPDITGSAAAAIAALGAGE